MSLTESHDAKSLEEYFVELGVKIGFLTPEKAGQLLKEYPQIVRCKECRFDSKCKDRPLKALNDPDWYCAGGVRKEGDEDV